MPNTEGAGQMWEDIPTTWQAGVTYTLDVFVGTPLINPLDGKTAGPIKLAEMYFLGDTTLGGTAVLTDAPVEVFTAPAAGQWSEYQISYTATAADAAGGNKHIGIEFYVDTNGGVGGGNDDVVNFDIKPAIPTTTTPEPGTFLLIGAGMVSLAYGFRRKFHRNS